MNNGAPLLCSLVELYPGVLSVTVTIQDPVIMKNDGMGKAGLRKGVFIGGDYGKRREAYRERAEAGFGKLCHSVFHSLDGLEGGVFSQGGALVFRFADGVPESGKGEKTPPWNRVTESETQCDFVIS